MFCCLKILPMSLKICMGMCLHQDISEESKKAKIKSSIIEQDLFDHAIAERNVVKILMLGVAESGKSTIIRQIKILHSRGFSKQELLSFKPAVFDNLLTSMKIVLQGMGKLRINLEDNKNKIQARSILSCSQCLGDDQELLPFVAQAFCALWADQGVRAAAARGYEYGLNDSALYFFENISRIISPNYIPSDTDVLRVRVRTCGIIETQFQVDGTIFSLVKLTKKINASSPVTCGNLAPGDSLVQIETHYLCHPDPEVHLFYEVCGQRSERRKWLKCFDSIHALLFVVALSSYDQILIEDPSVNRLQESLKLFSSVCTNTVFQQTSMILFLNKTDLFRGKILCSGRHLRFYLSCYEGADCDVDAAARHVAAMFSAFNLDSSRPLYHHFTTATDTESMKEVFHMLIDQIIKENLAAVQLL